MMTKHEFADWFAAQVQPRWPSWQVNAIVLNDWYVALGRYDAGTLTQAVRQHKIDDDPIRPSIRLVRAQVRRIAADAMTRPPKTEPPADMVTGTEFWRQARTTFAWQRRITLMENLAKLGPQFRDRDPEAYDWIREQRTAQAAGPAAS
ncbi:MAG: hypothetical protein GXX98_02635 [Planctomycetes bacterium]|jgi:hypothetical protein|nr:hypothetical protein [Planctomycetota bacterium]